MRLFILLSLLLVIDLSDAQMRWRPLANSPDAGGGSRHDDVFFINPQMGWLVNGDHRIYKTTDGGTTWQLKFTAASYLRAVSFADSLRGWAGSLDSVNVLYQTTDGGTTWSLVSTFPALRPAGICGLWAVNDSVVFGSGRYSGKPRVIKTTNRGISWTTMSLSPLASALVDCYFFNQDSGFIVGAVGNAGQNTDSAAIFFTSDGGATWVKRFVAPRRGEICWKICFPTPDLGFVSIEAFTGSTRFFLRTTNRGATWEEKSFVNNYDAQGIGFVNTSLGWIGGWGGPTYETTDGGNSWHLAGFGQRINRFRFFGDTLAYAAGDRVYKYSRDSTTSIAEFGQTRSRFSLEQNYPNPFNPTTNIRFQVGTSGFVSVKVYDLLGKEVATLVNNEMRYGQYDIPFDAENLPSGVYFYRLQGANLSDTRKMVLMR